MSELTKTLCKKALVVRFARSCWRAQRRDKRAEEAVENAHGTRDAGRFVKSLISPADPDLKAIRVAQSSAYEWHQARTLPWKERSARLLPTAMLLDYAGEYRGHKATLDGLSSVFAEKYAEKLAAAQVRLNGLFSAADYPSASEIGSLFSYDLQIESVPDTGAFFGMVSDGDAAELERRAEDRVRAAAEESMRDLWRRLYEPVKHLSDRLADPDAGFHKTAITNIAEICAVLPKLNWASDPSLERLRQEVEGTLARADASVLRENAEVRKAAVQAAEGFLFSIGEHYEPREAVPKDA